MGSRTALMKRRPRPVDIDGDQFFVRSMTLAEAIEVDRLTEAKSSDVAKYIVRRCVVEADGTRVFADDDEGVLDVPLETIASLSEAVRKVSSPGNVKATAKN